MGCRKLRPVGIWQWRPAAVSSVRNGSLRPAPLAPAVVACFNWGNELRAHIGRLAQMWANAAPMGPIRTPKFASRRSRSLSLSGAEGLHRLLLGARSCNPVLCEVAETVAAFSWNVHQADGRKEKGRKEVSAFNLLLIHKPDEEPKPRRSGPTSHSNFCPIMKTNRSHWRSSGHHGASVSPSSSSGYSPDGPDALTATNPASRSAAERRSAVR